jgi:hypothetical protein
MVNGLAGTGSWPQSPHGWQRQMRLAASALPVSAPCACTASSAYCEQVGVKRQPLAPNKKICAGEIVRRYARTAKIKMCWSGFTIQFFSKFARFSAARKSFSTPAKSFWAMELRATKTSSIGWVNSC